MDPANNSCYRFAPFLLDREERLLLRDGQQITLTPKAFDTLLLLVENSGHVLTKEEMLTRLWPDTFVEEANLTNNISILRRALGDEGQQYIETVPKRGYRFVAEVKHVQSAASEQSKESSLATGRSRILLPVAIAVVVLLLVTGGLIVRARLAHPSKAPLAFTERDLILITSFENRTGEPLFDGTIESALERELSNSHFVNVVPRERAEDVLRLMKKPAGTKIDASLGREVSLRDGGTRALITGRVEKIGTTYVMSVNLVDPFRDQIVASASEEAANQESLWPAIRRLSNWTRETLGESLPSIQQSKDALEKVTTPSLRALQLYTQGMAVTNQEEPGAAEQVLRQAVSEDSEFASAYVLLAWSIRNQRKPEKDWGPPSQRALDLSARTSERERYFIEGSYYQMRRQYEKAVSPYEALVQQYPDHFWGRNNLAYAYVWLGRYQEAVTQFAQAAELRPNDTSINRHAAWNLIQRDIAEARRVVQRIAKVITREMATADPDDVAWIQLFPVHDLWAQGDIESALTELDRWAQTIDSREGREREVFARNIGNCYMSFGKFRAAKEFFQRLPEKDEDRNMFLAEVAYAAGDRTKFRKHLSALKPGLGKALLLARTGFTGEAQKLLSQSKKLPGSETELIQDFIKIVEGQIALSRGQTAEAISILQEAIPVVRWNSSSAFFIESESLADVLERQGNLQQSVQVLERASREKAIAYENEGSTGQYWLRVQWHLAQDYRKLGWIGEAQKIEAELSKMLAFADPDHPLRLKLAEVRAMKNP